MVLKQTLVTRMDYSLTFMELGICRFRVTEALGSLFIEVPPRYLEKALVAIGARHALGIEVDVLALPWYSCWLRRRQWRTSW
jgi:hypothetical protein